ncbi:hypothetical protein [Beijerinckia sp. L45]|uniref:hypothetical protein n=1 Tax=Beijerinckia sp. L45 TaxID=1641855 RepID=UPI00131C69A8|nr:hypothetical protein [Beijerinckia sp. L45]
MLKQAGLLALGALAAAPASAQTTGHETIVFVRHGEKPDAGLGQLDCQGLNRALALPAVLEAKFGKPAALFAPNPSKQKDDGGKPYDYVRPLATIEPSAVRFGLPVNADLGFLEIDKLKDVLEQPAYHEATVVVAWEHKLIDVLVKEMMTAHGGDEDSVPKWHGKDFDSIYVVKLAWSGPKAAITFTHDTEGLDNQPTPCPK